MKRIVLLLFILAPGSLFSLEWRFVDAHVGFAWQRNAEFESEEGNRKQPDVFLITFGASVLSDFDGNPGGFYWRPGGWLSWNTEEVYGTVARPTENASIGHMKVLGLMLDSPFGFGFRAGKVDMGVEIGPGFYLRFPLWTAQNGTGEPADFWKAYYVKGEFLYLGFSHWVAFAISNNMDFLTSLRVYQPLSTFWTEAPILHGFQAGLTVTLRFRISPKADA